MRGLTPLLLAAALAGDAAPCDPARLARAEVRLNDFGALGRYRAANAKLGPPAAGERRVVFFGDSITEFWPLAEAFPGEPWVNRGVAGQTTAQMLVRFRQDVLDLNPAVVVILAGTNDLSGNTGPARDEDIEGNLATMAELASAHGIRVVLASILPVNGDHPDPGIPQGMLKLRPPARITAINQWMSTYAATKGFTFCDYATALTDARGQLAAADTDDGVHPNAAGYAAMKPVLLGSLAAAAR